MVIFLVLRTYLIATWVALKQNGIEKFWKALPCKQLKLFNQFKSARNNVGSQKHVLPFCALWL